MKTEVMLHSILDECRKNKDYKVAVFCRTPEHRKTLVQRILSIMTEQERISSFYNTSVFAIYYGITSSKIQFFLPHKGSKLLVQGQVFNKAMTDVKESIPDWIQNRVR